jgi:hypothetical protein
MSDPSPAALPTVTVEALQEAVRRQWGKERARAFAPALARLAEALATVERFPLPPGVEPFPVGPEAPHG